ncbi:MAG: carbohydrate kinase family protein [Gemmatimonadetes bacterium]|nr:carbohydrate kinase family protein [Gemmatimonadota bacterium]
MRERTPKRLGVVGTLVWDTIRYRDGGPEQVEEWGGVAYALSAFEAALPDNWEIVPIVKVGSDLSESAWRFLRSFPRMDVETGIRVVPEPNNRVELVYTGPERRTERLTGGVPPWLWAELGPLARTCDALYVNFISGFEMELDTARSLRAGFAGPTYADLHSLFLGIGRSGLRIPQELPSWRAWLRCFDAVQMNTEEFQLLGTAVGDPWALAARVVGPELKLIVVTLGAGGAGYVADAGFQSDPLYWPDTRHRVATPGPARSGTEPVEGAEVVGDPTGCGDVWGATFLARLLGGDQLQPAMIHANRLAAKNMGHRGASDLHRHLRDRLPAQGDV